MIFWFRQSHYGHGEITEMDWTVILIVDSDCN